MNELDYKKVFSKLSHIKALSHDQKFDEIVQSLITHVLNQREQVNPKNENELEKRIKDLYGISIRTSIIISNLDKLLNREEIVKDSSTKEYIVTQATSKKLNSRIEDANNLKETVKKQWFNELKNLIPNITDENLKLLWDLLKQYLSSVFEQHGVQTINFLNPQVKNNEEDQKSLIAIVESIVESNNNTFSKEILIAAINQFIVNADETRAKYISQLADATFTSFALTSDAETVNFLNKRYNNLQLFLDTNFIFGVLDLHKNSEDASAREILEEVKRNRLPFKLTFHPETLAEFKRAFEARALILRASKWTRESSRVAILVDGLSPIEELYHKQNIENETDPTVFLEKYDHVDLILQDLGLKEYTPKRTNEEELYEIERDVDEYQKFYEKVKHRKTKSFSGFKHDIIALREVRSLNPKKTKFLESNAFFISSDFVLARFEKTYYKRNWEINYVVNPSVFLQLIRPFIENDYSSNKRFIDTFSIPEFRSFDIDYSTTRSKALQIINDNYHSTSLETKVKILRDQVLLDKLAKANDDHDIQMAIIESQIAIENQLLAEEKENVVNESKNKDKEIGNLNYQIELIKEDVNKQKLENQYLKNIFQWEKDKEVFIADKTRQKKIEYKTASKYCRRPIALIICVIIITPLLIRYNNNVNKFIVEYGIPDWTIIILMIICSFLAAYELIYRTYVVDKEKTKNGIKWISTLGKKKKKKEILNKHKTELEIEFETINPKPQL